MFPAVEIGFGCHVTLVSKVIDFFRKYIINLDVTVTDMLSQCFLHQFDIKQFKLSNINLACVKNQGQGQNQAQGQAFVADFRDDKTYRWNYLIDLINTVSVNRCKCKWRLI